MSFDPLERAREIVACVANSKPIIDLSYMELGALALALVDTSAELGRQQSWRDRLEKRQDQLLALIVKISQETPLPDELKNWEAQRAKMLAEIGSLRSTIRALRVEALKP